MKKILKVMGVVAIFVALAVMVYKQVNVEPNNSILAKNIEALSRGENDNIIYKYRIKESCMCYDNVTGLPRQARIKTCEKYEWSIPMEQTSCKVTYCSSGSSCR